MKRCTECTQYSFCSKKCFYKKLNYVRRRIRISDRYAVWRRLILARDRNRCQMCGENSHLEVHHITPLWKIIRDNKLLYKNKYMKCKALWELKNGQTLCELCHEEVTEEEIKSSFGMEIILSNS